MSKAANGVGAEGGRALSEALKVNTALKELSMGSVQQDNAKCGHKNENNKKKQATGSVMEHVHWERQ